MAATTESFVLLIAGMAALGASSASTNSCRYAATDLAPKDRRAITLSMVVWVATVGAVVERSHRIDAEEFYRLLDGAVIDDVNIFNARLKEWQSYYNYERSPSAAHFGQSGPSEEPARVVDLEWFKPAIGKCRPVHHPLIVPEGTSIFRARSRTVSPAFSRVAVSTRPKSFFVSTVAGLGLSSPPCPLLPNHPPEPVREG